SLTALLVKVLAWALHQHPWLNSSLREDGIYLWKRVQVGVAVALPEGLIVPVVRDADQKNLAHIAREVEDVVSRARAGKLTPADVAAGTFTLSNLGPYGIESFTAILNPGQTGILAVGAAQREPLVVGDRLEIRSMMHLTLAVDHRVVDGAVAAQFLATLKQALETPALLLL
ncbi:MAG: 2-oxo acid dehydrogenase subunit E2, partial [Anaerolineaceae bacterium]|nr:2-oxo acid dehydrogenase subunit E2 [Anaerolineaceae bacterium]